MAHFAELDADNRVLRVLVLADESCKDSEGNESEAVGVAFMTNLLGGNWKQCSFNNSIRREYPSVGWEYVSQGDFFRPSRPYVQWLFDDETNRWVAPHPKPDDNLYDWDEEEGIWKPAESFSE